MGDSGRTFSRYRLRGLPFALAALAVCVVTAATLSSAEASEAAHASLTVHADVSARTSLTVSSELLQFEIVNPANPSDAVIEFSAGARTRPDGEVLLSVERLTELEGPGGNAHQPAVVLSEVGGQIGAAPQVVRRWSGSGLRHGTLQFVLRARTAGKYRVPVRFVLSAP